MTWKASPEVDRSENAATGAGVATDASVCPGAWLRDWPAAEQKATTIATIIATDFSIC
jgi:hypothetical protein